MKTLQAKRVPLVVGVVLLAAAIGLTCPSAIAAKDELTLRVNDAIGEPGGIVALVVRTYASRPVGQGQVCFRAASAFVGPEEAPFTEIVATEVFSKAGDALEVADLSVSENGQVILLEFSSDSGSINRVDGPLAVVYLRLRDDLEIGRKIRLQIDTAETRIFDAQGNAVPIEGRGGRLTIRKATAPYRAEADGDKVAPGEIAELGVETFEPFAMGSGQVGLRFDASVATGRPVVKLDKRYGARRFTVDRSTPGLVLVTFVSKKGTYNTLPGEIVSVRVATSPTVSVGDRSVVRLDPELTWFFDPDGEPLPVRFKKDLLEIEAD